ncbi:MAG TPA: hypothetical protein VIT45_14105 [Allosphingosinicella sp.]
MAVISVSAAPESRRRRSLPLLVVPMLLAGSGLTGGCATPYLHDASVETQTATVKEAYGKLNNEAYFAELRTAFATLQAQEDAARTEALTALRDRHLTRAIKPTDLIAAQAAIPGAPHNEDKDRGPETIREQSVNRLNWVLGACPAQSGITQRQKLLSDDRNERMLASTAEMATVCASRTAPMNLRSWSELPQVVRGLRRTIDLENANVAAKLKEFLVARDAWRAALKEEGKTEEKGKAKGDGPPQPKVKLGCDDLLAYPGSLEQALGLDGFPGYPTAQLNALRFACDLRRKALAHMDLESGPAGIRPDGRLFRTLTTTGGALLNGLERKAHEARAKRAEAQGRAEIVRAAIERLQKQIDERKSESQVAAAVKDLKEALADAPAAARLVGATGASELLEDILKVELQSASAAAGSGDQSGTASDGEASATTSQAEAVLAGLLALEQLGEASRLRDPDQRISALMIAIAAERQKADMAALEQERENERLALLERQELALLTEVSLLAEAIAYSNPPIREDRGIVALAGESRGRAISALNRYSLSWSDGRMPFELMEQRHIYVDRQYRVRMAERTAANWQSLIQPAINQLEAAGKGGIRPEIIAGLLGRLGISTAILED